MLPTLTRDRGTYQRGAPHSIFGYHQLKCKHWASKSWHKGHDLCVNHGIKDMICAMPRRPALRRRLNLAGFSTGVAPLYTLHTHLLSVLPAACVVCHFRLIWKAPLRPPLLFVDIKESIYIYNGFQISADNLPNGVKVTCFRGLKARTRRNLGAAFFLSFVMVA